MFRLRSLAAGLALSLVAACATAQPATQSPRQVAVPITTALAGLTSAEPATAPASLPSLAVTATETSSAPDRVVAPTIGMDAPVVATDWTPGGDWVVPNGAAGWLSNSAYPGQKGNTVLAGHHNTEGEVFKELSQLKVGDPVTVRSGGLVVDYIVAERMIVPMWGTSPEQEAEYATWIGRTTDDRLTLVTCWPYYTNSHRVLIIAKPADPTRAH